MEIQLKNIKQMYQIVRRGEGFDYLIIVIGNENQVQFWRDRLEKLRGKILSQNTKVLVQTEDWLGGAGQLLGTLYAWEKAKAMLKKEGVDLEKELKTGKRIAIYHSAGAGKRTAPLSLMEGKSAIKLPRLLNLGKEKSLLMLLEGVIFSTQIFAPSRKGRLSVFWGDQIIIPATLPQIEEDAHVELFGIKKKPPKNSFSWNKNWSHYGILILNDKGEYLQREKLSWWEFEKLKRALGLKEIQQSLGFFSLSFPFLKALLEEFKIELKEKEGKLDTDPHLWMPLTSSLEEYLVQGGSKKYWQRIQKFKKRFLTQDKLKWPLLRAEDLGEDSFWWDFGQIPTYQRNLLKSLGLDLEAKCLRDFFGLEKIWQKQKDKKEGVQNSILVNSKAAGVIKNSLVFNSRIKNLKVENSILIEVEAPQLEGKEIIAYFVQEPRQLILGKKEVLTDIFSKVGKIRIKTRTFRDGKRDWERKILGNPCSYERLTQLL